MKRPHTEFLETLDTNEPHSVQLFIDGLVAENFLTMRILIKMKVHYVNENNVLKPNVICKECSITFLNL